MTTTQKILAVLEAQLAAAQICETSGEVLGWPEHNLYVHWQVPGEPRAGAAALAEVVVPEGGMPEEAYAYVPIVLNGRGEKARLVRRAEALEKEVAQITGLIELLKAA